MFFPQAIPLVFLRNDNNNGCDYPLYTRSHMTAVWGGINFVTGHNTFQGNHNFSLAGFDQNNTFTDGTLLSFLESQLQWMKELNGP